MKYFVEVYETTTSHAKHYDLNADNLQEATSEVDATDWGIFDSGVLKIYEKGYMSPRTEKRGHHGEWFDSF